jgi:tetratricopeptide (TPR) repeat protein
MKRSWEIAVVLAGCLMAAAAVQAQAPAGQNAGQDTGRGKTDKNSKKGAQAPAQAAPPTDANPFPGDTSDVPVMPTKVTPDIPVGNSSEMDRAGAALPDADVDPVRSPDQAGAADGEVHELESSSDVKSMDSLLPGPGDDASGNKKGGVIGDEPKETAKEDISVGKYYMDQKNWRAAQSRFQSALVLSPDDPDVYWGLAESARHLGKFADARANYEKVMEYDPDSKHAKEAKKLLDGPEMAGAK